MKKITALSAALIMIFSCCPKAFAAPARDDISAKAAVLIEADSGRVIWGKSENSRLPMASTTKIMTTVLTLESGDLDAEFTVDSAAVNTEGSSMGLTEGDIVSKRDLCIGMLLPSGNDAANCAAVRVAGDIPSFAALMNAKAAELGLSSTHFVTPSGLHDPNHYSTACDMAKIAAYALKNSDFAAICGEQSIKLSFGNPPYDRWLTNTNKLLKKYDGCIGMKTGFTDEAGRCLVSAAERDGVTLICVTLNAPDDWNDHIKLFDYGFTQVHMEEFAGKIEYSPDLAGGYSDTLTLVPEYTPKYAVINGQEADISFSITAPPMVYAPVESGKKIGTVTIYDDGKEIDRIPMVAAESAAIYKGEPKEKSISEKIIDLIKEKLFS